MAGYSLSVLILVSAWAFDIGGAGSWPAWSILITAIIAWFVLPRLETFGRRGIDLQTAFEEEGKRPFPSFPVWMLQEAPFPLSLAGLMLMVVSSGVITDDPFRLNLGVRLGAFIYALAMAGMFCGPLFGEWMDRPSAHTSAPRPPRRRRRWDGSPRR